MGFIPGRQWWLITQKSISIIYNNKMKGEKKHDHLNYAEKKHLSKSNTPFMIKKKKKDSKKLGRVLACTCPEPVVLHTHLFIQREVLSSNGADLGRAMVARAVLGLLLLALLWPVQIYSNQTTVVTLSRNSSQNTWAAPNPWNATAKASGGALQSTANLFVALLSLLHL